jgi:hypothetical protein
MSNKWNLRFWAICLILNFVFGVMNLMHGGLWCIINFGLAFWMIASRFGNLKAFVNWVIHDMLSEIF